MTSADLIQKGFNHGYQLAQHDPALLDVLLKSAQQSQSDYFEALRQGKKQLEKENFAAKMKEANKGLDKRADYETN